MCLSFWEAPELPVSWTLTQRDNWIQNARKPLLVLEALFLVFHFVDLVLVWKGNQLWDASISNGKFQYQLKFAELSGW
jgi:hypothetical protein